LAAEVPIRLTVQLLVATCIALLVGLGGYALLLASRTPDPVPGDPVELAPFPAVGQLPPLPRRPSFVPASVPQRGVPISTAVAALRIEVIDLPSDPPPGAGVAVFAADTGARLEWLPLPRSGSGKIVLDCQVPAAPPLRLVAAPSEQAARLGWWTSTALPGGRATAQATLRAPLQRVVVHCDSVPDGFAQALRLRRCESPDWRPIGASLLAAGGRLELQLGPGEYELAPWTGGPWTPVTFRVPGPAEVTAVFTRPPEAPGGRP
jgi:hypothetical protein